MSTVRDPRYGRGARIQLGGAVRPPGPWLRPRMTAAEVHWSDGTWRPATIVAWYKLPAPREDFVTGIKVEWLVRLETQAEGDDWYSYRRGHLRPVSEPRQVSGYPGRDARLRARP